jgi:phenylpropionate dioxygenase-like ring-hydroxylating dioxygenase large terminal subunit
MQLERQKEILRTLFDVIDRDYTQLAEAAVTNPASDYSSPEIFQAEREALFRRRPLVVCMSSDIPESGDYCATEAGGIPLLVTRGADGLARCFTNICRHRGSRLVPVGVGRAGRSFRCGFHGWVYGLDGAVLGRPYSAGGFDDIATVCSSLQYVPAAEAHGLIFARPVGNEVIDVEAAVSGMGPELDEFGFSAYHRFGEWISEWTANWKLLADTFLESYHVPALHPDTVARHFVPRSTFTPFGANIRFHSLQKSLLEVRERPESEWELLHHATVEYFIAPSTILNFSVDHLAVYKFLPQAVDRTRVEVALYTPEIVGPDNREHFERTLRLHQKVAGGQDFVQQESIQENLSSGALDQVVYGRNEPAVIHFHCSLHDLLASEPR